MIIVTGATGQLGGLVVERLLALLPASQLGVSVRAPERAEALADRGVRVRRGDFEELATLAHAFEGASQLLLVSSATHGDAALRQHRAAIEAARDAGVGRIVYTSHMGVGSDSPFAPMRDHAATEAMLASSGVPFTSLRNGFYAASALMLLGQALHTGVLAAPEDGPVSWTAHVDLAHVAATVLAEGGLDGPTPALTGPSSLDLADLAVIAGDVTGRRITRTVVSDAEYRDDLVSRGVPATAAEMLTGMFAASRQGEFAAVDPTLERLLGRAPTTFGEVLTHSLAATPAAG